MGTMAVSTSQVMGDVATYPIQGGISPRDDSFEQGKVAIGRIIKGKSAIIVSPNQAVKVGPRRK